jgi:hypothetical protein
LTGLALRSPEGTASNATAKRVLGKKYQFPANERKLEALTLEANSDGAMSLVVRSNGVDHRIACGSTWSKGRLAYGAAFPEQPAAVSGAWAGADTFTAKVCFTETPFLVTWTLKFSGDEVVLNAESNVGFGAAKEPQLVGTTAPTTGR